MRALGLAVTFACACANVLSIEDAELDPALSEGDGGTGSGGNPDDGGAGGGGGAPPVPTVCQDYCAAVLENCTGSFAVYATVETCLAVCSHLPQGTEGEESGNTAHCRLTAAQSAPAEPSHYCAAASPGGNGVCGANCDSLCEVSNEVCTGDLAPWASVEACRSDCAGLEDLGTYSVDPALEMYEGAHVQCRLFHLSAAATKDADVHCEHVGGTAPCVEEEEEGGGGASP